MAMIKVDFGNENHRNLFTKIGNKIYEHVTGERITGTAMPERPDISETEVQIKNLIRTVPMEVEFFKDDGTLDKTLTDSKNPNNKDRYHYRFRVRAYEDYSKAIYKDYNGNGQKELHLLKSVHKLKLPTAHELKFLKGSYVGALAAARATYKELHDNPGDNLDHDMLAFLAYYLMKKCR